MATIFVISQNVKLYPLAHRLQSEGHQVSYFTTPKGAQSIPWPEDSGPRLLFGGVEEAADLYLLDSGGSGGFGDGLAKERKLYLGGSRLAVRAATNPEFRTKLGASLFPRLEAEDIPPSEGIRIALSGFFDGANWLAPLSLILSTNRLMDGNRGLDIGYSGSLLCQAKTRLVVGEGLTSFLAKAGYRGHLLVNATVCGDRVVWEGIELDSEIPFLLMWMELYKGTLFELLMGLSSGLLRELPLRREEFVLGLRLTLPITEEEIPLPPITLTDDKHLWPDGGVDGVVGCGWVTARGVDISECRRRVYRTVERTSPHPALQYRRDIGPYLEAQYTTLQSWGWVK